MVRDVNWGWHPYPLPGFLQYHLGSVSYKKTPKDMAPNCRGVHLISSGPDRAELTKLFLVSICPDK